MGDATARSATCMPHTWRERLLAVLRGATPEGLLFVPRLDIWYNRNRAQGTLPAEFVNCSLREIGHRLDLGFHSVVPHFLSAADQGGLTHRALGFYNHPDFPYWADFSAVDYEVEETPAELKVTYHLGARCLTTRSTAPLVLRASGSSIPDLLEHAVKEPADYETLAELFSRVRICPQPAGCAAYQARVGDDGLAVAYLSLAGGPMHHILRDLRPFDRFYLDLYDCPDAVQRLSEALAPLHDALIDAAVASAAEVVLYGANYDWAVTPPPFFEEHIAPWLNRAADRLHEAGKLLLTHTDGENQGLLACYQKCRFDVADSVCPAPMTHLSLREHRQAFGGRVTIWGGFPSALMLKSAYSDDVFRSYLDEVVEAMHPYDHLILSVADTLPPDADFQRLLALRDAAAATWRGRSKKKRTKAHDG